MSRFSFWATVCKTVRAMLSDRCHVCLSVLSVTLVHCGQTVGWIKTKLGIEVGLGPDYIVFWGPSCLQKGHTPNFRSMYVVPNGWTD